MDGVRRFLLLPLLVTLAGCDVSLGNLSARATDEWTHTYPLTAGGEIRIVNTNGRIEHEGVDGGTTNGSVSIDMASVGSERISLETTNGSVTLMLPEKAKATVSASVTNGGINVGSLDNFEVTEKARRRLEGKLNGGGTAI